jgi:hypothetical protein
LQGAASVGAQTATREGHRWTASRVRTRDIDANANRKREYSNIRKLAAKATLALRRHH